MCTGLVEHGSRVRPAGARRSSSVRIAARRSPHLTTRVAARQPPGNGLRQGVLQGLGLHAGGHPELPQQAHSRGPHLSLSHANLSELGETCRRSGGIVPQPTPIIRQHRPIQPADIAPALRQGRNVCHPASKHGWTVWLSGECTVEGDRNESCRFRGCRQARSGPCRVGCGAGYIGGRGRFVRLPRSLANAGSLL